MLFHQAMISSVALAVMVALTLTVPPVAGQTQQKTTDLIIALDGSHSTWSEEYEIAKNMISGFIGDIPNFGQNGNRVGVIKFSDRASEVFNLATYSDSVQAAAKVKAMKKRGGTSMTHLAIDLAKSSFDSLGRAGSSKMMLLITDGIASDVTASTSAADRFRDAGYVLITIFVEHYATNRDAMRRISRYLMPVTGYGELPRLRGVLAKCLYTVPAGPKLTQCLSERTATMAQGFY